MLLRSIDLIDEIAENASHTFQMQLVLHNSFLRLLHQFMSNVFCSVVDHLFFDFGTNLLIRRFEQNKLVWYNTNLLQS